MGRNLVAGLATGVPQQYKLDASNSSTAEDTGVLSVQFASDGVSSVDLERGTMGILSRDESPSVDLGRGAKGLFSRVESPSIDSERGATGLPSRVEPPSVDLGRGAMGLLSRVKSPSIDLERGGLPSVIDTSSSCLIRRSSSSPDMS